VALAELKASPPDIILLDLIVPMMDGFQLAPEAQRNSVQHPIPVILITARTSALRAGAPRLGYRKLDVSNTASCSSHWVYYQNGRARVGAAKR